MSSPLRPHLFLAHIFLAACMALAQDNHPAFAVATVKAVPDADPSTGSWSTPGVGKFTASHVTLARLIQLAYGVDSSQIANKPNWLDAMLYDVAAKPEDGVALSRDELKPRLQELLQQRFHLKAQTEMRPTRGYALVVAKGGPHLTPTKADQFPGFRINVSAGQVRGDNWSMPIFAQNLTSVAGFPVVDQTNLGGSYDISFSYAPADSDNSLPSLPDALKEATGLILKPQMVPVLTVVIESVDRVPVEN
jgi:uncharacterized protein (TIGR03435 family)